MSGQGCFSVIIENGTVIDGTGSAPFRADIGITGGMISAVGNLHNAPAEFRIDASERYVCPGFIDVHCHTDVYSAYFPGAEGKIMQGVTTDVCGLCGESAAPIGKGWLGEYIARNENRLPEPMDAPIRDISFEEYLKETNDRGNTTNMAMFAGNSNLRIHAMGYEDRRASEKELDKMKAMLIRAMEEGSFGLSTGLTYVPSMFASTEELIELCKVIAPYGGIYNSHMRNEGNEVVESVKEVIEIAGQSGCHGHVSHLKVIGQKNHGKSAECLRLIDKANEEGVNITFDVYPYTAGSSSLRTLLPGWVLSHGFKENFAVLRDCRERILEDIKKDNWDNMILSCGYGNIFIGAAGNDSRYEGKSITQIARENGISEIDSVFRVLMDSQGEATMIYHALCEEDLTAFMESPYCMIGTDAFARCYDGPTSAGKPHPRNYGGFPRFIRRYLLEKKVYDLAEGIHRITGFAAKNFGLTGRGELRKDFVADVTVFNPDTICDIGDYIMPNQKPAGIDWVLIGGQPVVQAGVFTDLRFGRMLHSKRC